MGKEIFSVHANLVVTSAVVAQVRSPAGLGIDEVGVLKMATFQMNQAGTETQVAFGLGADPDIDVTSFERLAEDASTLFFSRDQVSSGASNGLHVVHFPDEIVFPCDLVVWGVASVATSVNLALNLYWGKRKADKYEKSILMHKFGIQPSARDNIEEVGAKSPFGDI